MKTSRLILLLLVVGGLTLLLVQNTRPVLPLRFLGWQTPALPLAIWLLLAVAAGVLTILALSILVTPPPKSKYRPTAYSRFSEEPPSREEPPQSARPRPSAAESDYSEPMGSRSPAAADWGDWTQLRSPIQRESWDQPAPRVDFSSPAEANPPYPSPGPMPQGSGSQGSGWNIWPFSNQAEKQKRRAENSWQELSEGWDEMADHDFRPSGGSSVEDALDDISRGWDGEEPQEYSRDSTYAYGYGDRDSRQDNVYGPADDDIGEGEADWRDVPDYGADLAEENEDQDGDAGVVDADYRVIIPPYSPVEENDDDDNWVDGQPKQP